MVPVHHADLVSESMHALLLSTIDVRFGPDLSRPFIADEGENSLDTKQKRLVIIAAVACMCSYLATIGVVLLRCLPFQKNWQIYPYPGGELTQHEHVW